MSLETRPSLTVPAVRAARTGQIRRRAWTGASGPSRSLPSSRSSSNWVSQAAQARRTTSQATRQQASLDRQASQASLGRQTDRFQGPPYGQAGIGYWYRPGDDQAPGGLSQPGQQGRPAQPQQRQRPARPARGPRPTEPPGRELRQRAIASLVFGVISLLALLGLGTDLRKGVYLLGFSTAVGLAACVIGITALIKARRTGTYRPRGAIGGIVLGALATLISVPILVTYLAFPTQVNNYVNCLSQAQNSSQQQCVHDQVLPVDPAGDRPALEGYGRSDGPWRPLAESAESWSSAHRSRKMTWPSSLSTLVWPGSVRG